MDELHIKDDPATNADAIAGPDQQFGGKPRVSGDAMEKVLR